MPFGKNPEKFFKIFSSSTTSRKSQPSALTLEKVCDFERKKAKNKPKHLNGTPADCGYIIIRRNVTKFFWVGN
jgi:hypothetical protein